MKNFYLKKAPDSSDVLHRISATDLDSWRLKGGFMKTEGSVMLPIALGRPEADAVEGLMSKGENFVFWFSPDFRVVFTTKGDLFWKLRFECRAVNGTQAARVEGKLPKERVIETIANVFQDTARKIGAGAVKAEEVVEAV
jgi:hypothetical protein